MWGFEVDVLKPPLSIKVDWRHYQQMNYHTCYGQCTQWYRRRRQEQEQWYHSQGHVSFPFANQETTENTRRQLQRLGSKSVFLCNLFSWVRKSATSLRLENRNRRSLTNSALSIISNLVYAKWTKSVSQIDTYFNALTNTPAQDFRLESTWNSNMESRN